MLGGRASPRRKEITTSTSWLSRFAAVNSPAVPRDCLSYLARIWREAAQRRRTTAVYQISRSDATNYFLEKIRAYTARFQLSFVRQLRAGIKA